MEALLLVGGAFLIWTVYCWIASAGGRSPEESLRGAIEQCEKHISELEDRLRRLQAGPETPQQKQEVADLQAQIEELKRFKADEEESLSIAN